MLSTIKLPKIHLIATGGTIAGAAQTEATTGYKAASLSAQTLLSSVPDLQNHVQVSAEQLLAIDSKNATPADWQRIAQRAQNCLEQDDCDGLVITHGTDTLEETAYYLHLVLKSHKPVVLVGAMRPATALSADGPLNLLDAFRVAAHKGAWGKGVLVVLNHEIHGARDVTKQNSMRPDSFVSPNTGPLGMTQDGVVLWFNQPEFEHTLGTPFQASDALCNVQILLAYAGVNAELVPFMQQSGVQGMVVAGTGNGSLSDALCAALSQARQQGVAVVRASRCLTGYVMPNAGYADDSLGFVSAGMLNPYKARILLMLHLSAGLGLDSLSETFDLY